MNTRAAAPPAAFRRIRARSGLYLCATAAAMSAAACDDTGVDVGQPLEIRLELQQPTRTLGTPHQFVVSARGRRLATLFIDFGDGRTDTVPTFGAQSAAHTLTHAYANPGSYRVIGTVADLIEGERRDSVTAQVTPVP